MTACTKFCGTESNNPPCACSSGSAIARSTFDGHHRSHTRIRDVIGTVPREEFERDWQRQWLVERGVAIISEASRHLIGELKARHPEIPCQKVAGIGNILRHNYQSVSAPVIWTLAQADLPLLERVCREELIVALEQEGQQGG